MLLDEIKNGESDTLEFKRTLLEKDKKALKTIVAFANGNGGKVVFGIDDGTLEAVGAILPMDLKENPLYTNEKVSTCFYFINCH